MKKKTRKKELLTGIEMAGSPRRFAAMINRIR
jgi:hypothetical protein